MIRAIGLNVFISAGIARPHFLPCVGTTLLLTLFRNAALCFVSLLQVIMSLFIGYPAIRMFMEMWLLMNLLEMVLSSLLVPSQQLGYLVTLLGMQSLIYLEISRGLNSNGQQQANQGSANVRHKQLFKLNRKGIRSLVFNQDTVL